MYLNQLTRSTAADIAGALASRLWDDQSRVAAGAGETARGGARSGPIVLIGHDERPASPDIVTGVGAGLRRMGCRVIDVGLTTRSCFWFAVDHLDAAAGVHVSGAGSGPAWTGLDFVGRGAAPMSLGGGLDAVAARRREGYARPSRRPGSQRTFHAAVPYEAGLWKHFHALRPLRVAFACSNRLVRDLFDRIFRKLPCRLEHVVVPTRARNLSDAADPDLVRTAIAVRTMGCHFGVVVHDDGQQCAFLSETGDLVAAASLMQLLAESLLFETPGQCIVLESAASLQADKQVGRAASSLVRAVERAGGRCAFGGTTLETMSAAMRTHAAGLGGGASGRYWLLEPHPTCDAVLVVAKVLQALSRSDAPFGEKLSYAGSVSE